MKKLLALLFLFSALPLFGQGTSFPVFNRQGWTMAGAVVGTCQGPANPGTATLYCTSPVTTYTDWTLVVPCTQVTTIPNPPGPPLGPVSGVGCTNPGLTDSHGNATIFAANGFYWALVSGYQVVPQTFPFSIGGGGGGGGGNPCGTTYDVQLNISNGFGCDTGIFIETPSNHTTYNNVFSANQQLDVSDPANTGVVDIGHSTGTVVDGHFTQSLSSTFVAPGYGIDWPDAQPSAANQALRTVGSSPGADGRWATQWAASGNGVSLEYLYPLDYTNAPAPTQSNDLVRTLFPQGTSTAFMGPPPGSGQGPFVYQSNLCTGVSATASCTFLGPSKAGHAYAVVVLGRQATTVGNPTDTAGNTFIAVNGPGVSPVAAHADNIAGATTLVPINTISQAFDAPYSWAMIIEEIGDVPAVSPVEAFNNRIGGCSGSTLSFASVTTTGTDLIVGFNYDNPGGGPAGDSIYTASNPWYIDQQTSFDTGGLTPWMTVASIHGLQAPGTITPTATVTNCAGNTTTFAFKDGGTTEWAQPRFRYPTLADWVQQGIWPVLNAGQSIVSDGVFLHGLTFGSGLSFDSSTNTLSVSGTGAVTSWSGDGVLFDNAASTGAVTAHQKAFSADSIYGNFTAGSAAPSTQAIPACAADGSHALTYASHVLTCTAVGAAGSVPFSGITGSTNTTAAMVVGSGATLDFTGTGVIDANEINGTAFSGTNGHLVSFGASNVPADSGIVASAVTQTICSGTLTVNPGALSTNTCSSAITATCTGLATTDNMMVDFNGDPTATTGYLPGTMMTIVKYPTANTVNVKVCNNTTGTVTPTSVTLNYRVVR